MKMTQNNTEAEALRKIRLVNQSVLSGYSEGFVKATRLLRQNKELPMFWRVTEDHTITSYDPLSTGEEDRIEVTNTEFETLKGMTSKNKLLIL